jgi:pyridoxal phosphate enzyme (YggS family)
MSRPLTVPTDRLTSIPARLAEVRALVSAACKRAGRDPTEVTLVGVSKTHPLETVAAALEAGMVDLGENRAQEFVPKVVQTTEAGLRPHWHFIGHLQRNKVRQVLPHLSALHSVDSERLVEEITRQWELGVRPESGEKLCCYVEVNVAREVQKHGSNTDGLTSLLRTAAASEAIEVVGLMTVAPRVSNTEETRPVFRELRELAAAHGLSGLSMGMTEDYGVAIEEGATVVRVGRAIFGERRN